MATISLIELLFLLLPIVACYVGLSIKLKALTLQGLLARQTWALSLSIHSISMSSDQNYAGTLCSSKWPANDTCIEPRFQLSASQVGIVPYTETVWPLVNCDHQAEHWQNTDLHAMRTACLGDINRLQMQLALIDCHATLFWLVYSGHKCISRRVKTLKYGQSANNEGIHTLIAIFAIAATIAINSSLILRLLILSSSCLHC